MPDTHRPGPARAAVPVLLAVVSLGAACGAPASHPPATATRPAVATVAPELLRGAQPAAAQADAAGGVLGRQVEVVGRDDGRTSSARRTIGALLRLHPVAVVGPPDPTRAAQVAALVRRAGLGFVSLSDGGPAGAVPVTVTWTDDQLARVEVQELAEVMRARTVAVVEDPAGATAGVVTAMTPFLGRSGVAEAAPVALTSAAAAGAAIGQSLAVHPDAVILAGAPADAPALAAAAGAAGLGGRCLVVEALPGPPPTGGPPTGCVAGGVPPLATLPGGPRFAAAYLARFHTAAGLWAAFGDDAIDTVVAAVRGAGSADPARVAAALSRVAGLAGVTGDITVDPATGERRLAPLAILDLGTEGTGTADATWFAFDAWPPFPAK